jgi:hypothetical protein
MRKIFMFLGLALLLSTAIGFPFDRECFMDRETRNQQVYGTFFCSSIGFEDFHLTGIGKRAI